MLDKVEHSIENALDSSLEKKDLMAPDTCPALLSENAKEVFQRACPGTKKSTAPY